MRHEAVDQRSGATSASAAAAAAAATAARSGGARAEEDLSGMTLSYRSTTLRPRRTSPTPKQKANFATSGKLAEDANR